MAWNTESIPLLEGKTAVVTGSSSGIGFETAKALAEKRCRVILACRNKERGMQAGEKIGLQTEFLQLDLSRISSIRSFSAELLERGRPLDLLINNAGVMIPPLTMTEEGFELQFGVNHIGHFVLTAFMMPLLRDDDGARIVTVSSIGHKSASIDFTNLNAEKRYRPWDAYGQSKLANLLFAYELERRLRKTGAKAVSLAAHPGVTATELTRHSRVFGFFKFMYMKTRQGALPVLRAATDPEASGGEYFGPGGFMEMRGAPVRVRSSPTSNDPELASRLWNISEKMTGVEFPV